MRVLAQNPRTGCGASRRDPGQVTFLWRRPARKLMPRRPLLLLLVVMPPLALQGLILL